MPPDRPPTGLFFPFVPWRGNKYPIPHNTSDPHPFPLRASRQGFTDAIREIIKRHDNPDNPATVKLTVREEVLAGMIGGAISCWNHPFEVRRNSSDVSLKRSPGP